MTVKKILVCDVCERNGVASQDFHERIAVERIVLRFSSGGTKTQDLCGNHLQAVLTLLGTDAQEKLEGGEFKCSICERTFQSKSGVSYHMKAEHGDDTGTGSKGRTKRSQQIPCPVCERTLGGPQGLAAHMRSVHPEYEDVRVSSEGVEVNGRKMRPHKNSAAALAAAEG